MIEILCGIGRTITRISLATALVLAILAPLFAMAGVPVDKIPTINLAEMLSNTKLYMLSWQLVQNPASIATMLPNIAEFVLISFALTSVVFMIAVLYMLYMVVGPIALVLSPFLILLQVSMFIYIASNFTKRIPCS